MADFRCASTGTGKDGWSLTFVDWGWAPGKDAGGLREIVKDE